MKPADEKGARSNIVLIGMPGAGKSTLGVLLAKRLSLDFVDTDLLIQTSQRCSLQQILEQQGYTGLRRIEEEVLLDLQKENHVIATGGSAVYSPPAMAHLQAGGRIVFIDVDLATLLQRITDFDKRGIVRRPGQSLADLYTERHNLYNRYAEITIDCSDLSQEKACHAIADALGRRIL